MIKKIRNGFKNSKGLTLVELLVAIGVTITAATVVVAIITASFRTTSQIGISEDLRQSGNTALSQVSKTIQFADHFVAVFDSSGAKTTVCPGPNSSPSYSKIKITSDGTDKTISCVNSDSGDIDLNLEADPDPISFIDLNKVTINSCSMTCTQGSPSEPPLIGIELDLSSVSQDGISLHLVRNIKMRNL